MAWRTDATSVLHASSKPSGMNRKHLPISEFKHIVIPCALLLALASVVFIGRGSSDSDSFQTGEEVIWTFPSRTISGVNQRFVGNGARGAVLLWSEDEDELPRKAIVFLHAWLPLPPSHYGSWIQHLVRRGNAIIYPVYQQVDTKPRSYLDNALAGIAAGLHGVDADPEAVIAVGETTGGALAFDYAAAARDHELPVPGGVLAAYPGRDPPNGELPPAGLSRIPARTRLVAISGPGNRLPDGDAQARSLLRGATGVPNKRRRYLSAPLRSGPRSDGPRSRRAFWAPLDRLITAVRGF